MTMLEDNNRLRVKRIPLLPRQVKTYFGITSGSENESDIELDNEEEREEMIDDVEFSSFTPIPSFHVDLSNSAFQSTTYCKSTTSTPLTDCSSVKDNHSAIIPKASAASTSFNCSTMTQKTPAAKSSALTPALTAVPSFHCSLPPSPFYSTYPESRLAASSRMMEFEDSDSETIELEKSSRPDFGSKAPLAAAETKIGEGMPEKKEESMLNATITMAVEESGGDEELDIHQMSMSNQLEENLNLLVNRCVDAQTSISDELGNLYLDNTSVDQEVAGGGQKARYSLYYLSRVEDIGVQTSPFFNGGCENSQAVNDGRRKTIESLEDEQLSCEKPMVLSEIILESLSGGCVTPTAELIDEIADEHNAKKKTLNGGSVRGFTDVGVAKKSSMISTPLCRLESDYQRPHSPVSMSADQNESLRSFNLPSPIRPVLVQQQSSPSPPSTPAKRYIRPRISAAPFTVTNPTASQIQELYASLKSPSVATVGKLQRRFSKFATPSTMSTVSSPRRSSMSTSAVVRSPVASPTEKLVARRATMSSAAFNNNARFKAKESPVQNTRKSLPVKSSCMTLSNTTASNLALKSVLKRGSNSSAGSPSAHSAPNVLREIYVNYATPPSASRRKSVTFRNVSVSFVETDRPSTTVTKTNSNRFSGVAEPLVDYASSHSPSTTMADATNDSALCSPCAKQIVLKRGLLFAANNANDGSKKGPSLRVNKDSMLYETREDSIPNDCSSGYYGGAADDEEDTQLNSTNGVFEAVMRSNTAEMRNINVDEYEGDNELRSSPFVDADIDVEEGGVSSSKDSHQVIGRQSFFNSSMFTTGGADESVANCLSDENGEEDDAYLNDGNEEEDISSDASPSQIQHSNLNESVRHFVLKRGPVESPSYILKAPKIRCSSTDSPSAGILRRSKRHRVPRLPPGQEAVYKYGDNGTRTLVGVTDLVVRDKQLKKYRYVDPILAANEEWEAKHQKKVLKDKKKELRNRYNKVLN